MSSDDRAYFWEPDGDVVLSNDMIRWMELLSAERDEIESGEDPAIDSGELTKVLIDTLYETNEMFLSAHFGFQRTSIGDAMQRKDELRLKLASIPVKKPDAMDRAMIAYAQAVNDDSTTPLEEVKTALAMMAEYPLNWL